MKEAGPAFETLFLPYNKFWNNYELAPESLRDTFEVGPPTACVRYSG